MFMIEVFSSKPEDNQFAVLSGTLLEDFALFSEQSFFVVAVGAVIFCCSSG